MTDNSNNVEFSLEDIETALQNAHKKAWRKEVDTLLKPLFGQNAQREPAMSATPITEPPTPPAKQGPGLHEHDADAEKYISEFLGSLRADI